MFFFSSCIYIFRGVCFSRDVSLSCHSIRAVGINGDGSVYVEEPFIISRPELRRRQGVSGGVSGELIVGPRLSSSCQGAGEDYGGFVSPPSVSPSFIPLR